MADNRLAEIKLENEATPSSDNLVEKLRIARAGFWQACKRRGEARDRVVNLLGDTDARAEDVQAARAKLTEYGAAVEDASAYVRNAGEALARSQG